ncbi:MAG: hypothetical protein Q9213_000341 [Squamulea squamosa]
MHYLPILLAGALYSLSVLAQGSAPSNALFRAITEYKEAYARLIEVRSDCERTLISPLNCTGVFGQVATDINQANGQLDTAAQTFVPKVPCATISAVFTYLQGNISRVNTKLRDIACEPAVNTQAAAKLNADAFRRALSDQIVKYGSAIWKPQLRELSAPQVLRHVVADPSRQTQLGSLFAKNDACNNKQNAEALQKFANTVQAIDADDKKTAQAFTLLGGTLGCLT